MEFSVLSSESKGKVKLTSEEFSACVWRFAKVVCNPVRLSLWTEASRWFRIKDVQAEKITLGQKSGRSRKNFTWAVSSPTACADCCSLLPVSSTWNYVILSLHSSIRKKITVWWEISEEYIDFVMANKNLNFLTTTCQWRNTPYIIWTLVFLPAIPGW